MFFLGPPFLVSLIEVEIRLLKKRPDPKKGVKLHTTWFHFFSIQKYANSLCSVRMAVVPGGGGLCDWAELLDHPRGSVSRLGADYVRTQTSWETQVIHS